jgi:uncharacterized membrane protein YdbT with pleckstrin-like domain
MMKKYIASRLVNGNRLFPTQIIINDLGVTVKIPSLFSGKEQTIPFSRISSVNIDCPFVGYSTIVIETTGEGQISANGFLKSEVIEMKELILSRIES